MTWSLLFFTTNIFLGIGLAMDAFSVSMANGLNEPHMNKGRVCTIAGVFGGFQALMPLIGWFCVHTIAESFHVFEKFIPWIALILLLFIGGKMLIEGIKNDCIGNHCARRGGSGRRGRNPPQRREKSAGQRRLLRLRLFCLRLLPAREKTNRKRSNNQSEQINLYELRARATVPLIL